MTFSEDITTIFTHPFLSNEVGDVSFVTSHDKAEISLKSASDSSLVYSANLFPDKEGVCTAYQLGDTVENWMLSKGLSFCQFVFKDETSDTTVNFSVILCRFIPAVGAESFQSVADNPLLSSKISVIPMSGVCRFHFIAQSNSVESLKVSAVVSGHLFDGSIAQSSMQFNAVLVDNKIGSIAIPVDSILSQINESLDAEEEFSDITSVNFYISEVGNRKACYLISYDQDLVGFDFINRFGLPESLWLHSEVLPDLKVESESAFIGHRSVLYDVERSQSFKVEAANISNADWHKISQFLMSDDICEIATGRRILLSEVSQDHCRTYDSLGSVKFSFSYDDDRVIL